MEETYLIPDDAGAGVADAGETIALSRAAFTHVEREALAKIRPTKFRQILRIDTSIPWWMESYEYDLVQETAQWLPTQEFTEDFATASVKLGKESFPLVEMISGYRYRNREMVRAAKLGQNLDSARAAAVFKKAETTLDHIAADGTLDGAKALHPLIKGIYNQTSVSAGSDTSTFQSGSAVRVIQGFSSGASWEHQYSQIDTLDKREAWFQRVVDDVLRLETASERATKETTPIDKVVLPLSVAPLMQVVRPYGGDQSVEQAILSRARFIKSIVYWNRPDAKQYGADSTHKRRIVGLASNDMDAARFVLPRAPLPGRPVQVVQGVHVPVTMVLGGFNSKMLDSIVYADLADPGVTS